MDLKGYYQKLRQVEKTLAEEFVVVKSLATVDGGVAGRLTEVVRGLAAKLIVDGLAVLAEKVEAEVFRRKAAEEKKRAEEKQAAAKIQFSVLTDLTREALQKAGQGTSKD